MQPQRLLIQRKDDPQLHDERLSGPEGVLDIYYRRRSYGRRFYVHIRLLDENVVSSSLTMSMVYRRNSICV